MNTRLRARSELTLSPSSSATPSSLPQRSGEASPAGGGTWAPCARNHWPRKPSGVHEASPIRPPGRVTRRSSAAVVSWSGANIAPNTDSTAS